MTYSANWRDNLVYRVCNWLLNHVATKEYRASVSLRLWWGGDVMDNWLQQTIKEDHVPSD